VKVRQVGVFVDEAAGQFWESVPAMSIKADA
jgi:hypothetical protein